MKFWKEWKIKLVGVLLVSFFVSGSVIYARHDGQAMSNMPGMSKAKAKPKSNGPQRKKRKVPKKRQIAKKHDMSNMPRMNMPGMKMPGFTFGIAPDTNEYAWHANAVGFAFGIAADADEYARHADATGFAKSTGFASAEDGHEHADAWSQSLAWTDGWNERHGRYARHGLNEYGAAVGYERQRHEHSRRVKRHALNVDGSDGIGNFMAAFVRANAHALQGRW